MKYVLVLFLLSSQSVFADCSIKDINALMLAQVKKITEATVEGSPTKVEVSNIYLNDDFVQLGDETIVSAFFDFTLVYSSTESETLKNSIHSRVDLASCSLKSESATNVSGITLTKAE